MQTRTTKELFELMLQHTNQFDKSLCFWILNLWHINIISFKEVLLLLDNYIRNNRPSLFYSWEVFKQYITLEPYYWEEYNLEPRVKWIKKQIKKLK